MCASDDPFFSARKLLVEGSADGLFVGGGVDRLGVLGSCGSFGSETALWYWELLQENGYCYWNRSNCSGASTKIVALFLGISATVQCQLF